MPANRLAVEVDYHVASSSHASIGRVCRTGLSLTHARASDASHSISSGRRYLATGRYHGLHVTSSSTRGTRGTTALWSEPFSRPRGAWDLSVSRGSRSQRSTTARARGLASGGRRALLPRGGETHGWSCSRRCTANLMWMDPLLDSVRGSDRPIFPMSHVHVSWWVFPITVLE